MAGATGGLGFLGFGFGLGFGLDIGCGCGFAFFVQHPFFSSSLYLFFSSSISST